MFAEAVEVDTLIFDVDDTMYPVSTGFSDHRNRATPRFMVDKLGFNSIEEAKVLLLEFFARTHSSVRGLLLAQKEGRLPPGAHYDPKDQTQYWCDNLDFEKFLTPNVDFIAVLEELSKKFKIVAFSNSPRAYVLKCLDALGVRHIFPDDRIFGVDDVAPHGKPKPEAFQIVFDKVGCVPERSVMFEDSGKNVIAIKRLGMHTVFVDEPGPGGGEAGMLSDSLELGHPSVDVRIGSVGEMRKMLPDLWEGRFRATAPDHALYMKSLTVNYFNVWNKHDEAKLCSLHAPMSTLKDWDASHGPTNADVAKGVASIWAAEPEIRIAVLDVYTTNTNTCIANIVVYVNSKTSLKVCDVIEYEDDGNILSIHAYKV